MAGGDLDFSIPLADFLATAVSGGTWADVVQTLKTDEPGKEADAADIAGAGGQLWANVIDDLLLAVYGIHQGSQTLTYQTTDATVSLALTLASMVDLGETWRFEGIATAVDTASDANRASCKFSATVVRIGIATFTVVDPVATVVDDGMPAMVCEIAQVGATDDIGLYVTGIAAMTIDWYIRIKSVERII